MIIKQLIKRLSCIIMRIKYPHFISCQDGTFLKNVKVCKKGGGNLLNFKKDVSIRNSIFHINGSNNLVEIHEGAKIKDVTFWMEGDNNKIVIGASTTFHGKCQLAACEGTQIMIGKDCMFSHDIYIRTTDSHSIVDKDGNRTNQAKDISIGNHVWIGMQSLILKGSTIPDNCVVGARSIISSSKEHVSNSILIGNPAKTIKTEINWSR